MSSKRSSTPTSKSPRQAPAKPSSVPIGSADATWTVPPELAGKALDGVVRALANVPWSLARRWIESGKIAVDGSPWTQTTKYVLPGSTITRHPNAPSAKAARVTEARNALIEFVDQSVVVVRKPAGISTVPFGDESPDEREKTLDAVVRDVLAKHDQLRGRAPLGVVQRLDKMTSGLLVFARSFAAKKHLGQQLRNHSMRRVYLAIAHGDVPKKTFRSRLIENRGDGLRGSLKEESLMEGQLAVTHVEPIEKLKGATLIACRLETGRTHQIRIHLSESGHPLVGEAVYIRNFAGTQIKAPRLMLHAKELGFAHPRTNEVMLFEQEPPEDFETVLRSLRG